MSVSRFVFRYLLFTVMALSAAEAFAQEPSAALDRRQHVGYEGWQRITPTHVKAQYAGGMGVASIGAGWDYGRRCRWESDVMFGILPKAYADETHFTISVRQNYIPWSINLSPRFDLEPFTVGAYINYITGERFWVKEPGKYPGDRYYSFTSRLRLHLALGQRLTMTLPSAATLRSITLYYELSANDLNIIAKVGNRHLTLADIFHFSAGVKFQLFNNAGGKR